MRCPRSHGSESWDSHSASLIPGGHHGGGSSKGNEKNHKIVKPKRRELAFSLPKILLGGLKLGLSSVPIIKEEEVVELGRGSLFSETKRSV